MASPKNKGNDYQLHLPRSKISNQYRNSSSSKDLYFPQKYLHTFLTRSMACIWKQTLSYWRNIDCNGVRIVHTEDNSVVNMVENGEMMEEFLRSYFGFRHDFLWVVAVIVLGFSLLFSFIFSYVQSVVVVERTVLYKEKCAGMYSPFAYALAQFLWFIYFTFFTVLYFTYYGMMLVAISPNLSISSMTTSVPNSILNLLPGFVIPKIFVLIMAEDSSVVNMVENGEMMEEFLRSYFGFRHDFLWVVAAIVLGFSLLFSFIFSYGIKTLNIQTR
ncbi:hypothetical protein V2J09_013710 [Rumex salicifolius]